MNNDNNLFLAFKAEVDRQFRAMQKNGTSSEDTERYMQSDEYNNEIRSRFHDVKDESDIKAIASSCTYCLYMCFE